MAKRKIERLSLNEKSIQGLKRGGVETCRDLFSKSTLEIMCLADLSSIETEEIIQEAASKIVRSDTLFELLQTRSLSSCYLPTGISGFDEILSGGLIVGSITEICGPPGIGKTQFCLSCCSNALIQSSNNYQNGANINSYGSVLYFDTELKFSIDRLIEIISSKVPSVYNPDWAIDAPHRVQDLLKRLHLRRPTTCQELLQQIEGIEEFIIENKVSLIIIDSIASLAKKEGLNEHDKETYILRQSSLLKRISDICSCCILVTNQITPYLHTSSQPLDIYHEVINDSRNGLFKPALGQSWHHCITTRFILHHINSNLNHILIDDDNVNSIQSKHLTVIDVVKSPIVPLYKNQIVYEIDRIGIVLKSVI